jgi:hypothetical protein
MNPLFLGVTFVAIAAALLIMSFTIKPEDESVIAKIKAKKDKKKCLFVGIGFLCLSIIYFGILYFNK